MGITDLWFLIHPHPRLLPVPTVSINSFIGVSYPSLKTWKPLSVSSSMWLLPFWSLVPYFPLLISLTSCWCLSSVSLPPNLYLSQPTAPKIQQNAPKGIFYSNAYTICPVSCFIVVASLCSDIQCDFKLEFWFQFFPPLCLRLFSFPPSPKFQHILTPHFLGVTASQWFCSSGISVSLPTSLLHSPPISLLKPTELSSSDITSSSPWRETEVVFREHGGMTGLRIHFQRLVLCTEPEGKQASWLQKELQGQKQLS